MDLMIQNQSPSENVFMLIPGLDDIEPILEPTNSKRIIIFGRVEPNNDKVKQYTLALDAIGAYIKKKGIKNTNISIDVFGYENANEDDQREINKILFNSAGKSISVSVHEYIQDEKEMFNELKNSSLCIMPSTSEGFGLVGYEAIAAGVPVIISQNSGLYEFLSNEVRSSYDGDDNFPENHLKSIEIEGDPTDSKNYTANDLNNLTKCICDIFDNYKYAKNSALELRKILIDKHYSWNYFASQLIQI